MGVESPYGLFVEQKLYIYVVILQYTLIEITIFSLLYSSIKFKLKL